MLKIQLNTKQRNELEMLCNEAPGRESEKALMVLMSAEGVRVSEIAKTLRRNPHTVRRWLKRFKVEGIAGLSRKAPPGRPSHKTDIVKAILKEVISRSPAFYGFNNKRWTVADLARVAESKYHVSVSKDTIARALKIMGYRYSRPHGEQRRKLQIDPSEKIHAIDSLLDQIKKVMLQKETTIHSLDDTYASVDPYVPHGWSLKRWPPVEKNALHRTVQHTIWMIESPEIKILLEKVELS